MKKFQLYKESLLEKITANGLREIDSIKLRINNSLVEYLRKEEGVPFTDTPSSFTLRDVGISTLNLDIAI
ncbi:MAG TPA: hypothetical protein DIU45_19655 [Clostridium sp.]|nr:hypothetical protein [Clostridium sp.]